MTEQRSAAEVHSRRGYLVFVVAVLMLISTLKVADRELLAPLYEPVSEELGLNDLQFGMIRSATNVALILGAILFGILADRWRRRDVVALGVLCWSGITWGTGRVQSFFQLLLARSSMTFFEAAFSSAAYPMVSDMVPRRSYGSLHPIANILSQLFGFGSHRGAFSPKMRPL